VTVSPISLDNLAHQFGICLVGRPLTASHTSFPNLSNQLAQPREQLHTTSPNNALAMLRLINGLALEPPDLALEERRSPIVKRLPCLQVNRCLPRHASEHR
jgi:hypothetical protein